MTHNKKKRRNKRSVSTTKVVKNGDDTEIHEKLSMLPTTVIQKYEPQIFVYKKKRPISHKGNASKWSLEGAQKAIFLEQMFRERQQKSPVLEITFPDQVLNSSIVRGYSSNIDTVNFLQSFAPRSCYVTLKLGSNVKEEIAKISKIPFNNGFLRVKIKLPNRVEPPPIPREIDPSALYVGNLPPDISINEIKEHFPNAIRIEVGYSIKKKWRRYALVKYSSAEEAMRAFAVSYESQIRSATLIIRFHRVKQWKILEETEARNEVSRLKIKKEKVDEEYESALRKAQIGSYSSEALNDSGATLAPAQYPIARPLIDPSMIKKEPTSPEHTIEEEPQSVNMWSRCMQYFQYMMMNQSQSQTKSHGQHDPQDMQPQIFQDQMMQFMQQQGQITDSTVSGSYGIQQTSYHDKTMETVAKTSSASIEKDETECSKKFQILDGTDAKQSSMKKNAIESKKTEVMKLPRIPKKRRQVDISQETESASSTKKIESVANHSSTKDIHQLTNKSSNFVTLNDSSAHKANKDSIEKPSKRRKKTT